MSTSDFNLKHLTFNFNPLKKNEFIYFIFLIQYKTNFRSVKYFA